MIDLSIPIKDIRSTLSFYRDILGCTITRQQKDRLDIELYGHHLVAQLSEEEAPRKSITISPPHTNQCAKGD